MSKTTPNQYRFVFVPLQSDGTIRIEDVLSTWDKGEAFEGCPVNVWRDVQVPEGHTIVLLRVETGTPVFGCFWKPRWTLIKGVSGQFLDAFRSPKG